MNRITPSIFLYLITTTLSAQLKVSAGGGIGFGIEPRSDYKLIMKGDLMLTTWPEIPIPLDRFTELRFKVGNGWPGCEFGTPTRNIAVWSSEVGFNNLYAAHYYTSSDAALKGEVTPITDGTQIISGLNPVSYHRRDTIGGTLAPKLEYGFIAQDIQQILPSIIDSAKGSLLVDYTQIIPILAQAVKEQQLLIDSLLTPRPEQRMVIAHDSTSMADIPYLQEQIDQLKMELRQCCSSRNEPTQISGSKLFQNNPNPFNVTTTIAYEIGGSFTVAQIIILDLQGNLKMESQLNHNSSSGTIVIPGGNLSAGMYIYSLIVDGTEVDSKRMILLK